MFISTLRKSSRLAPGAGVRRWFVSILAVVALAGASTVWAATAGSVDIGFGVAGKAITQFPNSAFSLAVAIQPDGKVVVAGGSPGFSVARYNRDGSPDTTFGNGGIAFYVLGPSPNGAHAVLIQPDGKIVLAGESGINNPDHGLTLVRFTAAGVLDPSFGGDGIASVEIGTNSSIGYGVAIQPSGALVVAGTTRINSTSTDVVVARFTAAGILDLTFGVNGVIQEHAGAKSAVYTVVTSPDGKILVGGNTYIGPFNPTYDDLDFLMYRYNANGSRDNTFGASGRVIAAIGAGPDVINSLALQPDGKIIAAGYVLSDNFDLAIVRFTATGQLDAGNFASGGKLLVDFGASDDIAYGVAVDPDGYIVAGGVMANVSDAAQDLILVRCEPDGDLDPQFGTNGKVRHNLGGAAEYIAGIALQPNLLRGVVNGYKIVATGYLQSAGFNFATVRFRGRSGPIQRAVVNDFDNDGLSELAAFRPQNGNWIIGKVPPTGTVTEVTTIHWGAPNDKVVPGDYDGDGKYDVAVYRGGSWHILNSGDLSYRAVAFGLSNDIPVPADYDGDGRTDVAVFRPSNGAWYFLRSSDGTFGAAQWGANGDIPVTGDFDRDDVSDLAVYRGGTWYILQSLTGQMRVEYFGLATDKPVAFDYDGDSKTDIGVFRAGDWYYVASDTNTVQYFHWGQSGDVPLPGRYGTPTGLAFNHGGQWWLLGRDIVWLTGPTGDIPVPTYFAQ
ncbi:MAG: FG-GAP-like repeat-containing protein [Pyrinomonadaceae bacterium]